MIIDPESRPALATFARLRNDPLSGEAVLVYPEGYLSLGPTAQGILSRCDGSRTVGEIIAAMDEELDADADELSGEVLSTLGQLADRNLIVFVPIPE